MKTNETTIHFNETLINNHWKPMKSKSIYEQSINSMKNQETSMNAWQTIKEKHWKVNKTPHNIVQNPEAPMKDP